MMVSFVNLTKKHPREMGVVVQIYNPSDLDVETGGWKVLVQPGLVT